MPGTWEITANHWYYSRTSPIPMAHIVDSHILLEKNGLSNSSRCLFKILPSEEIGQFYICNHLCNRIRPTPGSIASPLQLITQCTPREKDLPQLPSTLGAKEMHQTQQELMKRQGNKPEKSYIELTPGTPVWVQHRQNATWKPATVVSQCTPSSYWIMQENGTKQPKVYRRTRSMLKIRSTPTEAKQTGYMNDQSTESEKAKFHTPAIPNTVRDCVKENSLENISPDPV